MGNLLCAFLLTFTLINVNPIQSKQAQSNPTENNSLLSESIFAVDDNYLMLIDCNTDVFVGNLLDNDKADDVANMEVAYVVAPKIGLFSCGPAGNFVYIVHEYFDGIVEFRYRLQNKLNHDLYSDASVKIAIRRDSDCDHIYDLVDLDCDNDGILNFHEGSGEIDTDKDGIPDSFDIDSDNDGITDLEEWQNEASAITPSLTDVNADGWDDAFDSNYGGDYYEPVDTDQDGIPDFQDSDSDNDLISDFEEALDPDSRTGGYTLLGLDCDNDGLDDFFDTISCCAYQALTICSSADLPDSNGDKIRDWRDPYNSLSPDMDQHSKTVIEEAFVYPNPVNESCTVLLENLLITAGQHIDVKIYSTTGALLYSGIQQSSTFNLNFSRFPQGIYLFRAYTDSRSFRASIIKN
ncbi:MAG TPA: T9SS type A sorting domain-containing protein [Draconibacterium sp.]|nr:T9SS type A sorting domain-containing protein [Draconibacterium sp.]